TAMAQPRPLLFLVGRAGACVFDRGDDGRDQTVGRTWLLQYFEGRVPVRRRVGLPKARFVARQDHDRDGGRLRVPAESLQEVEAVGIRQQDVEDDDVRPLGAGQR